MEKENTCKFQSPFCMDIRCYYWGGATSGTLKKLISLSCLPVLRQQLVAGRVLRFTIHMYLESHDITCKYPCLPWPPEAPKGFRCVALDKCFDDKAPGMDFMSSAGFVKLV